MNLHPIDLTILLVYLAGIVFTGFYLRSRAAGSVEDYFLAGRRMHWFWISMSGSVTTYDITGTMWIVSMFYIMGLKGIWIHSIWGFLMPAFFMTFAAKWVRRSNVITGAEWLTTRFGEGPDGRIARLAYAVTAVIFTIGLIGYAFQGIGKFCSVYLPLTETQGAILVMGITALYAVLGGMYSVIVTDVIQTIILTIAATIVGIICYNQISYEALAAAVPPGWLDIAPSWRLDYLSGEDREKFQFFGLLCIAWTLKGLLLNAGGPGQLTDFQRVLSTRSARDSSKVGAAWSFFLITRWGMCTGITALAVIGVEGITDPEKVLPHVLNTYIPVGLKGIVLAGFFAAFMSTFDSTINVGASYLVKDIYQGFIRPNAGQVELSRMSYLSSILVVLAGLIVGYFAESIQSIWNWLMMVFGAGYLVPNLLRWYWWRFNAWGVVASLLAGMALCIGLTMFYPTTPDYVSLYVIVGGGLVAAIGVTLVTQPTDRKILETFYKTVQPGGCWKPVRQAVAGDSLSHINRIFARDVFNTIIASAVTVCLYLTPMYAVIHDWTSAGVVFAICLAGILTLAFTWYPYLPED